MGNNAYICVRLKFNIRNTKPKLSIGTVRLCEQLHTLDTQGLLIHVLYSSCVQENAWDIYTCQLSRIMHESHAVD